MFDIKISTYIIDRWIQDLTDIIIAKFDNPRY